MRPLNWGLFGHLMCSIIKFDTRIKGDIAHVSEWIKETEWLVRHWQADKWNLYIGLGNLIANQFTRKQFEVNQHLKQKRRLRSPYCSKTDRTSSQPVLGMQLPSYYKTEQYEYIIKLHMQLLLCSLLLHTKEKWTNIQALILMEVKVCCSNSSPTFAYMSLSVIW
jgi:hypothetical protein